MGGTYVRGLVVVGVFVPNVDYVMCAHLHVGSKARVENDRSVLDYLHPCNAFGKRVQLSAQAEDSDFWGMTIAGCSGGQLRRM